MDSKNMTMRATNKGLTVKINLFALEKWAESFDSESARLWIKGAATNAETREEKIFNDAGELISILGRWNAAKLRSLRKASTT